MGATVTEFPIPAAVTRPDGIAAGPDGTVWFADGAAGKIGRITSSGTVTEYPSPITPLTIVAGPDGALWFSGDGIGRITTAGAASIESNQPTTSIAVGPDGALWFTFSTGNWIGRITTDGYGTEFPAGSASTPKFDCRWTGRRALVYRSLRRRDRPHYYVGHGHQIQHSHSRPRNQPDHTGARWRALVHRERGTPDRPHHHGRSDYGVHLVHRFAPQPYGWTRRGPLVHRMAERSDRSHLHNRRISLRVHRIRTVRAAVRHRSGARWRDQTGNIGCMVLNTTTPPVLSIAKIHSGVFPPGQPNVYTVTIANASGLGPTSGPVTVTETPPAGLTVVSMSGVGWTCASGSLACSRSDVAASGAGYPPITVAVNVASTASSPQVNAVTVSGGGSANATATDSTTVLSSPLSIASTHSGSFIQGQQNAAYTLTVSNAASGTATIGAVMVTDSVSSGLALLSMSGPGWTCGSGAGGMTCGRGDPLAASASYPPITALVSVSPAASSPQVNTVSLSGSGAPMATATDSAAIVPPITGTVAEYPLAFAGSAPGGIAAGPDGALWFTEKANSKIGRISTNGAVTEYSPPTPQSTPAGIAAGPDGALWFTEEGAGQIGRITAAGAVTEYHASGLGDFPTGIAAGPDVALWYTELNGNRIGRISTGGTSIEYPLPTVSSGPTAIAAGPDGALWFTESYANQIGRITTGGAINEYPVPTAGSNPAGIAAGPDGALWFTENSSGNIGRISTDGAITEYPAGDGGPQGIALGPDGALWFTESIVSAIGRIDPSGVVSQTPLTITENTSPQPSAIAAGPDGGKMAPVASSFMPLTVTPASSSSTTRSVGDFSSMRPENAGSRAPGGGMTA